MKIAIKIYPMKKSSKKGKGAVLLAFASITFDKSFAVSGIRILKSKGKTFIAYPQRYNEADDEYYGIANPITKEFREELDAKIIAAYEKAVKQDEVDEDDDDSLIDI